MPRRRNDSLLMETTEISPEKTAGEIVAQLISVGANEINQSYKDGKLVGLKWVLMIHGEPRLFDMPVRIEPIYQILQGRRREPYKYEAQDRAQAARVAWRQLLRWVEVQIAMITVGMAEAREVFLPYLWDPATNQTLYQFMEGRCFKALSAPQRPQ